MPLRRPSEDSPHAKILLVDDNSNGLKARKSVLEEQGHTVAIASGGEGALECFRREKFDLVITDYKMPPGMDGVQLISRLRELCPDQRIILLSGFADTLGLSQENTKADAVIQKSAQEVPHLLRAVDRLVHQKSARKPPGPEREPKARRKSSSA
jgi:CheY-like chemotaxis protein